MDDKRWYSIDADKLIKYFFSHINELYEEKIKKIKPKNIKISAEVLQIINEIKVQVILLKDTFETLLKEQANLNKKKKIIKEICNKINRSLMMDLKKIQKIFLIILLNYKIL